MEQMSCEWAMDEFKNMDRKSRKIMNMHREFHPKSDTDRLCLTRGKGGRGLISCEGFVWNERNNLGLYIKNSVEPLIWSVFVVIDLVLSNFFIENCSLVDL